MTDYTGTEQGAMTAGVSPVIRRWQIGLIVVGTIGLLLGGLVLVQNVAPTSYVGIAIWLLGALILHDGIVAAGVLAVQLGLRKVGRRIPLAVIGILQGAIVVGAVMSLLAVPGIYKSAIGANNPTVVPLAYGQNLVGFYVVLIAITAITVAGYLLARRQKTRPSRSQA